MRFGYFVPIREADGQVVDDQAGTARVVIITEGLGNLRDRNYYARSAVESCSQVFNGKQFYVDHPSKQDEENRPERSMRDLAGYFYDTSVGTVRDAETGEELAACFGTLKFATESEPGRLAFAQVKAALEYQRRFPDSKDVYAGISINGGGVSHQDTIRGMPVNMVTEIKEAFSADVVTKPARGGKFLALRESDMLRGPGGRVARGERPMVKTVEARRREAAAEAKRAMLSGEGLTGIGAKMSRLVAAINEPPEDPDDLIHDIQGDLDALDELLNELKAMNKQAENKQAEAKRKAAEEEAAMKTDEAKKAAEDEARRKAAEGEAAKKAAEGEAGRKAAEDEAKKAAETEAARKAAEGEAHKKAAEDEARKKAAEGEHDYGMGVDDEEEEPEGSEDLIMSERMRYQCESCGSENEVMPPKGFRLAQVGEQYATESQKMQAIVTRLRRAMESKEARFMEANKDKRNLMQEVIKLRAKVTAYERVTEARKQLHEAGVPRDILSATDLLAFEPHQWATQIKAAKRVMEGEAKLVNQGGRGPKDANLKGTEDGKGSDAAISTFRESYAGTRN